MNLQYPVNEAREIPSGRVCEKKKKKIENIRTLAELSPSSSWLARGHPLFP
jgi:hypothetical protein